MIVNFLDRRRDLNVRRHLREFPHATMQHRRATRVHRACKSIADVMSVEVRKQT